jgi:ferredoxin
VPHAPLAFAFCAEVCTQCGRCVTVCAYNTRRLTPQGEMLLDEDLCRSCGLCASVCPTGALSIHRD